MSRAHVKDDSTDSRLAVGEAEQKLTGQDEVLKSTIPRSDSLDNRFFKERHLLVLTIHLGKSDIMEKRGQD